MDGLKYVLDANVLIEAARRYYAFDIAPPFWAGLCQHFTNGRVMSIDRVQAELMKGQDDLSRWAANDFREAFMSTDEQGVIESFSEVMRWVQAQPQYLDAAKASFAAGADGWLVAFSRVTGHTVVTHEIPSPTARRKIPIPIVCINYRVPFIDTYGMLRDLGVRFR